MMSPGSDCGFATTVGASPKKRSSDKRGSGILVCLECGNALKSLGDTWISGASSVQVQRLISVSPQILPIAPHLDGHGYCNCFRNEVGMMAPTLMSELA